MMEANIPRSATDHDACTRCCTSITQTEHLKKHHHSSTICQWFFRQWGENKAQNWNPDVTELITLTSLTTVIHNDFRSVSWRLRPFISFPQMCRVLHSSLVMSPAGNSLKYLLAQDMKPLHALRMQTGHGANPQTQRVCFTVLLYNSFPLFFLSPLMTFLLVTT